MFDVSPRWVRNLPLYIALWRHRCQARFGRLARAMRYVTGCLSADDAQRLMLDCREPAGWHPLLVLTVEDTLAQAREEFADHLELPRLVAEGCARVGDKWESYNDELSEARRWAIDLARQYAAEERITLIPRDDVPDPATA